MLMALQVELLSWKSEKDISGDGARTCRLPQADTFAQHGRVGGWCRHKEHPPLPHQTGHVPLHPADSPMRSLLNSQAVC